MQAGPFTTDFATVLGVAAGTSVLSRAARLPAVLGYLAAGLVVGPYVPIPVYADPTRVAALAEFGVVLVMLCIGLEFRLSSLRTVLPTSGLVGLLQVLGLGSAGYAFGRAVGFDETAALFLASSVGIASTMVVSNVYATAPVAKDVRAFVFGTLVVQDLLAILLIAAMTAVASGVGLDALALAHTLGRLALVLGALVGLGLLVVPRLVRLADRVADPHATTVLVVGLAFGLGVLVQVLGYSVALGAFVAGSLVAEAGVGDRTAHALESMKDVFGAVFFVAVGMSVDPRAALAELPAATALAALVVVGQLAVTTLAGTLAGNGLRRSVLAGASFGQVGEFGFILAGIGTAAGVVPTRLSTLLVTTAVLTTLTTPFVLRAGTPLVSLLDRRLPPRISSTLSLYEAWLERVRAPVRDPRARSEVRRVLLAVALDAGLLAAGVAAAGFGRSTAVRAIADRAGLDAGAATLVLGAAVLLVAAPFVFGLVRLSGALGRLLVERSARAARGLAGQALAARGVQGMVLVAALTPAGLALAPQLGSYAGVGLVLVVLVLVGAVYGQARAVDREVRSFADSVVAFVAAGAAAPEGPEAGLGGAATPSATHDASFGVLPAGVSVRVEAGDAAVGRTLSALDVRARTGATVVAIERDGTETPFPTGDHVFAAGDRVVLVGTSDACDGARALLRGAGLATVHPTSEAPSREVG